MELRARIAAASATMLLVVGLFPALSHAQERGQYEFSVGCAECHGADGQGDGPIAQYLVDEAPPLISLSANNGGVFPVDYVVAVLEGTADIGVHGRDMPLWGPRYRAELMEQVESGITQAEAEALYRVRTLSLIEYLASIQQDYSSNAFPDQLVPLEAFEIGRSGSFGLVARLPVGSSNRQSRPSRPRRALPRLPCDARRIASDRRPAAKPHRRAALDQPVLRGLWSVSSRYLRNSDPS